MPEPGIGADAPLRASASTSLDRLTGAGCAVATGLLAWSVLGGPAAESYVAWVAAALVVYRVAATRSLRAAAIGLTVMLVMTEVAQALTGGFDPVPPLVLLLPGFACGRTLRHWRLLNLALADTAAALAAGREAHAALAVADERARIARELHDVVGHAVSLIVVQATAGRRVAGERPGDAWEALNAIDLATAQAGEELVRLAAVVDAEPETLDAVIAPAVAAGLRVTVPGDPPVQLDGLAIRVIQEALTNTLKHAGPTTVAIDLVDGPESVTIRVSDDGPGGSGSRTAAVGSGGFGLVGMRERIAAAGGTLSAGPRPQRGWEVVARIPRAADVTRSSGSRESPPAVVQPAVGD